MTIFAYDSTILAAFPHLVGGLVVAEGIVNGPTSPELLAQFQAEQQATLARIGGRPLSELPSLAAWRSAFRAFGVDPTKYRCAAEALMRRLTKQGDIPSINTLVDIGNLASIRYGLPVCVINLDGVAAPIRVRFAEGNEPFRNLNQDEVDTPAPGEVIFTDALGRVVARRWCWRQSEESGARESTTRIAITIEAQHPNARADVEAAVADLVALLAEHTGVPATSAILSSERSGA